jgi:hypothetical protein
MHEIAAGSRSAWPWVEALRKSQIRCSDKQGSSKSELLAQLAVYDPCSVLYSLYAQCGLLEHAAVLYILRT